MTPQGDPGKIDYFRNPNWKSKPFSGGPGSMQVDPRVCPGCLFPCSKPATAHVNDARCQLFRTQQAAMEIESGNTRNASQSEIDAMTERIRKAEKPLPYAGSVEVWEDRAK